MNNMVEPSEDLIWHACNDGFQCARLSLPLDWLDPSNPSRVTLAITKIPATDLADYRGPVFTNPGGPGGAGTVSLRKNGRYLQAMVGKNHDIVSFDPRGVGASTPRVNCWASRRNALVWELGDVGVIDAHEGVVYDAYARAAALSTMCEENMEREAEARGEESLLKFVGTASVARDMLEIMSKTGTEKMRYWGFSYGTFLGGVFAAMYPDKVERMVSDGNVDYLEWSTNTHKSFLHDSDKVMEAFYHYCHLSGPTLCAFYSPTPSRISTRLQNLLASLKTHPIIVPSPDPNALPEIVTYSSLKRLISASLYRPMLLFPSLAHVLLSLEAGDGSPFLDLTSTLGMREPFPCQCPSCPDDPASPSPEDLEATPDAAAAIMCADGGPMRDSISEFQSYAASLMREATAAGAVNAEVRMGCAGRKSQAKFRFAGPFQASTAHPILYIANAADNVTPLRSALANAQGFPGSVVLVLDAWGHTSLAAPSVCAARWIRSYFQTGEVPGNGTVCAVDGMPFGGRGKELKRGLGREGQGEGEGEEERKRELELELSDAGWELMMNHNVGMGRRGRGV
ncbi:hypothetical protein DSL72_006853 [Monilinia vaccinii-corymbosi]|uniref:Peptidase S33 tripeptidyl aminopeptidase-like C-terminal domain-containing protein n=1 Tax=Monilinia vaccinii-corymbosi TaxID=61207 RepID=A0A8A3PLC0_9HELO|nr:hypothetical protein DSL72_006853 [Monilinia vaccinii-corymbosi]